MILYLEIKLKISSSVDIIVFFKQESLFSLIRFSSADLPLVTFFYHLLIAFIFN